jgi:hypothetical protein
MIAATPWAATGCKIIRTFMPCTYGGEGKNALGDACGERVPDADAATGPA